MILIIVKMHLSDVKSNSETETELQSNQIEQ